MREPEQMTIEQVMSGDVTVADFFLYGGAMAVGAIVAIMLLKYFERK